MPISITGQLKVSTLQSRFLKEFGPTLRIYDGRSFADPDQTLAQVRKKKGSGNDLSVAKNMKLGNLEDKFEAEFGLKVQVAGSDDSYLCDNDLTLNQAQLEDEKKIQRKDRKSAKNDSKVRNSGEDSEIQQDANFKINAGWEKRDGRAICRWIIVWREISQSSLAGALGGYSGGGTFQLEQFFAKHSNGKLTSVMIDMEDKITGQDIEFFDDVPEDALETCDDAQDIVMEWNDQEEWEDADSLILCDGKEDKLSNDADMLLIATDNNKFLKFILESAGITAAPS